jgi:hypothetical protein
MRVNGLHFLLVGLGFSGTGFSNHTAVFIRLSPLYAAASTAGKTPLSRAWV